MTYYKQKMKCEIKSVLITVSRFCPGKSGHLDVAPIAHTLEISFAF